MHTLCYMCAHCVTCVLHIVLHVLHMRIVRVTCVKCVHIVLHVRCTLCYMYSHMLHVRFYAAHVLYHNERFGIVKISCYFSYKVKFDIKTFAGTH